MIVRPLPSLLVAFCVLVAGCQKTEIASYRIPKEKDPEMPLANASSDAAVAGGAASPSGMAQTPVATAQGAALTWTAPAHWQTKPGSAMRKGSYTVPGESGGAADMAITAFPNDVGGELANVNRWRAQIQLPPIQPDELPKAIVRHRHNGLDVAEVDLVGTSANPQRILGAWVAFGGATWFFKMMGPDAIVAKEKEAFAALIDSIRPASAAQHSTP